MKTRKPTVAGQFYPADRPSCLAEIRRCIESRPLPADLPPSIVAGIVPHAGWTFSGSLAALVFSAVKRLHPTVHTFVIFGAAHSHFGSKPVVDDSDFWDTPVGRVGLDEAMRDHAIANGLVVADPGPHRAEHSIEVQVPFIVDLFPDAKILPIIVPPTGGAIALGEAFGDAIGAAAKKVVTIGSTDLTHYGPRYGFTPMGAGPEGLRWASTVNDRRFIDLALRLDPEQLLAGAMDNGNACGPGAAAAVVAAAKKAGADRGVLLAYANSNEILLKEMGTTSRESVGYAAIVFGPS